MADNLNITAGAGTVIATDQVAGSEHYQKIKIADGTADSTTMIASGGGVEAGALRVTVASDSTGVLSIDDNGGAITVDGTVAVTNADITALNGKVTACNTGAVVVSSGTLTAVTAITNALPAGTALLGKVGIDQVTANANEVVVKSGTLTAVTAITNALPAGTNAIGKLAANSGVDIGDVDVTSVPAPLNVVNGGTEATALRVTIANDSTGLVSVDDNGASLTVDNAALSVVGGGVEATALRVTLASDSTGVISVDDNGGALTVDGTVAVTNAALTSIDGKMVSGTDIGDVTINNGGSAAAVNIQDGGNTITVDGTVTVGSITAGDNNIGNVDIVTVPAPLNVVGGGAEATALRVTLANDSTGVVTVDAVDLDIRDLTSVSDSISSICTGAVAHDAVDSGSPIKIGAKAVNMDGTVPGTAVAEDDRANNICDLYGRLLVDTMHPNFWSVAVNYTVAQTATEIKAAPGAGLSLYITDVVVSNGATAGNVKFVEDTAAAVDKIEIMYFAVNGGAALHFRTPIKLTANKNFGITSVTCTTHSVTINGYTAP